MVSKSKFKARNMLFTAGYMYKKCRQIARGDVGWKCGQKGPVSLKQVNGSRPLK